MIMEKDLLFQIVSLHHLTHKQGEWLEGHFVSENEPKARLKIKEMIQKNTEMFRFCKKNGTVYMSSM